MTVVWEPEKVIKAIDKETDRVERRLSQMVRRTAHALAPRRTGTLRTEIKVKTSKFKNGGYIVQPQGPGNYTRFYATFVEFGTSNTGSSPYLRPAIKKHEKIGHAMLRRAIL